MRKVGKVLSKAVPHDEALRAARAQAIMREWPEIVGEELAKRSCPDRYGKGTVWVAVSGSAWAQEMRMRKELILHRLRERAEDPTLFQDIRFGVRPLPTPEEPEIFKVTVREPEEPGKSPSEMSIRDIAKRRLANWKKEE